MSYEVQGIVDKVFSKPNRKGNLQYNLLVRPEGQEEGTWYGCFTNKPNVSEGQVIKFTAEDSGNFKNADVPSIQVVGEAVASPTPQKTTGGRQVTDNRQASIVMQSSSRTAVELLNVLVESGAVSLGKADSKAAAAKKYDVLMSLHEELTVRLYNRATKPELFHSAVTARLGGGEEVIDETEDAAAPSEQAADEFSDF